jgi:hypothetical protein
MSRWWRGRPTGWSLAAAALVAIVGLVDQLPKAPGLEQQERIASRIAADREVGEMLEGKLAPGAMVFQMPVMTFPEAAPSHQLGDYEHFRPYLATRSLRFSYGMLKGRSRGNWQENADEVPVTEFVRRLERYGFSALYFNRKGFPDGGEKLLADLAAMGRPEYVSDAQHEQVVVFLRPSPNPEPPLARRLTFGRGWQSGRPGEPRWAYGPASLSYYNPLPRPLDTQVRFVFSGIGERHLKLQLNRRDRFETQIAGDRNEVNLKLTLQPGVNRLDLETAEPAVRISNEPGHLRSFALHEATVRPVLPRDGSD